MNRKYLTLAILSAIFNSGVSNSEVLDELFEENNYPMPDSGLLKSNV